MSCLIFCVLLCLIVSDTRVAGMVLSQFPEGITVHREVLTWDEAYAQCQSEDAVLASPIDLLTLRAMKSVIGDYDTKYFIGVKASESADNSKFVSVEGIPIERMPPEVTLDMIQRLDQEEGHCLAMRRDAIYPVPCWNRLPYMCSSITMNKTNCGPVEEGYKYEKSTGSCYKLHKEAVTWNEAVCTCLSEGGYLLILDDLIEVERVKYLDNYPEYDYIHIGIRKASATSEWKSVHDTPVAKLYNEWRTSAELNNPNLLCGAMHKDGKLDDIKCMGKLHFICEKKATI